MLSERSQDTQVRHEAKYIIYLYKTAGFPNGTSGKEPVCQCRRLRRHRFNPWVRKIPLEEEMATHSSILAWRTPWTQEPGRLQSIGSNRVAHD